MSIFTRFHFSFIFQFPVLYFPPLFPSLSFFLPFLLRFAPNLFDFEFNFAFPFTIHQFPLTRHQFFSSNFFLTPSPSLTVPKTLFQNRYSSTSDFPSNFQAQQEFRCTSIPSHTGHSSVFALFRFSHNLPFSHHASN